MTTKIAKSLGSVLIGPLRDYADKNASGIIPTCSSTVTEAKVDDL